MAINQGFRRTFACVAALLLAVAPGCFGKKPTMAPAPNLYTKTTDNPYADVPPALQTNTVDVLYATDRAREKADDSDSGCRYGARRSRLTSFGLARVAMGEDLDWDELVAASKNADRKHKIPLQVTSIDERGRYPRLPPAIEVDGKWTDPPEYINAYQESTAQLHQLLSKQLARTPRKEVYVFVHGYNNTFETGCYRAAQLWHYLGREGVPALFSWPAGSPGLLRGYTRDRESGEFANAHLKTFLRACATCPDVQKIHLVAHSRGTDIMATAIRELHLEHRAAGQDTREALKLGQIVLAAPDIDLDVFIEKFSADRVGFVAERLTIYVSPYDKAIGLSNWLFGGSSRLGKLALGDLSKEMRTAVGTHPILNVVDVRAKTKDGGHGYFLSSPACLSDVILVLRDFRRPGAAHGRPLIQEGSFWELRENYPISKQAQQGDPVINAPSAVVMTN